MTGSALYTGFVTHQRLRPTRHRLRYRAFWMLLDLDELPGLNKQLRWFSHNRFNLLSLHERDFGSGAKSGLRGQVAAHLAAAGIDIAGGTIQLLCMPRVLGYVFNPLSLYFCHRPDGGLAAILYEVTNTFGERHTYLIPVAQTAGIVRQGCAKRLYVSPFMEMAMSYDFRVRPPGRLIDVAIDARDAEGMVIATALHGRRAALTDAALLRVFLGFPLLTLKVIAAIHWEALRLWLKGMRITLKPAAPAQPVTVGPVTVDKPTGR
jgi:DUF1365 family protein